MVLYWLQGAQRPSWLLTPRREERLSDKTVAQKLLLKDGSRLLIVNAPDGYRARLGPLPAGVEVLAESSQPVDAVQLFVTSMAELQERLVAASRLVRPAGLLWVTYPKQASKVPTDLNRTSSVPTPEHKGCRWCSISLLTRSGRHCASSRPDAAPPKGEAQGGRARLDTSSLQALSAIVAAAP